MRPPFLTLIVIAGAAVVPLFAAPVAAQEVVVQGHVVERGGAEGIAGAAVELSGTGRVLTNPNGVFVFPRARTGRRTLTVTMFGYERRQLSINVRGDTSIVIEMDIEAVPVDPLTVKQQSYAIRGQVMELPANKPVMDAEVSVGLDRSVRTNGMGRFRLSRLQAGELVLLQVQALGLMPARVRVDADRDTSVNVALEVDPVAQRMLSRQIERLEQRTARLPHQSEHMDRPFMMERFYSYNVFDIVEYRLNTLHRRPACVFLDEIELVSGLEELKGFLPDQIERIEFIDRGTMIRVYTRSYIQEMLRGRASPGNIVLIRGMKICK